MQGQEVSASPVLASPVLASPVLASPVLASPVDVDASMSTSPVLAPVDVDASPVLTSPLVDAPELSEVSEVVVSAPLVLASPVDVERPAGEVVGVGVDEVDAPELSEVDAPPDEAAASASSAGSRLQGSRARGDEGEQAARARARRRARRRVVSMAEDRPVGRRPLASPPPHPRLAWSSGQVVARPRFHAWGMHARVE